MPRKPKADLLDALFAVAHSEAQRRKNRQGYGDKAGMLRAILMACQRVLERDKSKRIAVRSPRQTGKSTAILLIALIRCIEKPASTWVIIGITRLSAKNVYWGALKALNEQYEIGLQWHNQELVATLPNGSQIKLVGADNVSEIEKLRGGRYDGVVIDESKSFPASLYEELVHDVLEPALMAKDGVLILIGTPGDELDGPFYEATCETPLVFEGLDGVKRLTNSPYGSTPAMPFVWSLHQWTMRDNTTVFQRADGTTYTMWDQAELIKQNNGWDDNHPTWRREYLGFWVPDTSRKCYRYHPIVHDYVPADDTKWGIPEGVYETVIAVDLGTRDGTGIVVWAYNIHEKSLWEVHSEKRKRDPGQRLPASEIAGWYKDLEEQFGPFVGWPCDPGGLATMVMDTLADDHGVYLEPAEKTEKDDHVELMNDDFDRGMIHIRKNSLLSKELREARWDRKKLDKLKRVMDDKVPNDVSDAGLYGWRFCNHRKSKPRPASGPALFTTEWYQEEAMFREALEAAKRRKRTDDLDAPYWLDS